MIFVIFLHQLVGCYTLAPHDYKICMSARIQLLSSSLNFAALLYHVRSILTLQKMVQGAEPLPDFSLNNKFCLITELT